MRQLHAGRVELETKTLEVDGCSMSYSVSGHLPDPPLVFIPGWAGSIAFFEKQIVEFEKTHRVIAIDYPGFGLSSMNTSKSRGFHRNLADQAQLVGAVLQEEQVENSTIVGHSIGGALGLTVAALFPAYIKFVVGADSLTYLDLYPKVDVASIDGILEGLISDYQGTAKALAGSYFLPGADQQLKDWVSETMASSNPETGVAILEAFLNWDLDQYLEESSVPIHVIASEPSFDKAGFIPRFGDRINVTCIPDVGHFVMMENPVEFNKSLRRILSKII